VEPEAPVDPPLDPIVAFASIHCVVALEPDEALLPLPAEPVVPVAPVGDPPPRCRQPVTVTVRLL